MYKETVIKVTELSFELLILMLFQMLFSASISFWSLRERYEYKYKNVVIVTLAMSVLNCFVGVMFVMFLRNRGVGRILSIVIVQCIFGVVIYIHNFVRGNCFVDKKMAKFSVLFNLPLIPHYLSMYILNSIDRLMIQKMYGASEVGLYSVVYNISMVLQFIVDSLNSSLTPWIYDKMEEKDKKSIEHVVVKISGIIFFIIAIFILIAPEAIMILAGDKYMDAVKIVPSITCSIICIFLYQLMGNIEFYYSENKFTMYVSFIGAALNIGLNLLMLPVFGYLVAGWTTLISYIFFVVAHTWFANSLSQKYDGNIVISPKIILGFCLLLVIYSAAMTTLYDYPYLRYILIMIVFSVFLIKRKTIVSILGKYKKES